MTSLTNRQTRKRLATRQRISDVATRLFMDRGFDEVTIDQIAEAADVARMTVFNHFARKEDMFFDLDDEARQDMLAALEKDAGVAPVEAMRLFAHAAVAEKRPYLGFYHGGTERYRATVLASEALMARVRVIRDELTDTLTTALATGAKRPLPDAAASLAASLLVATGSVALSEAYRTFHQDHDVAKASATFLRLVDQGIKGIKVALEGTPYQ